MNLDFKENYILQNESVLLRPLIYTDRELLIDYAINEPEIWHYNINGGNGKENFDKYLATAIKQINDGKDYPFIVFDKKKTNMPAQQDSTKFQMNLKGLILVIPGMEKSFKGQELINIVNIYYWNLPSTNFRC